ncbi:hypothetical protein HPP92_012558 [Vanilla planifolia]|uniref:Cyclin n=1 Tax=Vanilla planifolia TaxID=51239 RepID=A0A835QX36_VANPL|nr:hypothetical protein HPP92_012558 [Vanilla planifolia]
MAAGEQEVPKVVAVVASLLERAAEASDYAAVDRRDSPFRGRSRPCISIRGYVDRIFRYAGCSPSCYVVAYVYLHRFSSRQQSVAVDSFSIHRLFLTCLLLAVKFVDDLYYNNAYYAKVGGISTAEMNVLELDFLFGLGFDLNVTLSMFDDYCRILQSQMCVESPSSTCGVFDEEEEQSKLGEEQQLVVGGQG